MTHLSLVRRVAGRSIRKNYQGLELVKLAESSNGIVAAGHEANE